MSRRAESGILPGTYAELKRGRKPCPECDVIIGAGRKKCPVCGTAFGSKKAETSDSTAQTHDGRPAVAVLARSTKSQHIHEVTLIPAGKCPVELLGSDEVSVVAWSESLAKVWRLNGSHTALALEAVEYWARQFFPFKTPEHTQVCSILRQRLGVAQTSAT